MCTLPTSCNLPETRGPLETVSYANVMAKISEKMTTGQQIAIMMKEFGYSRSGASSYLKRNKINSCGKYGLSVYDVEKFIWADMSQREKIDVIMKEFGVTHIGAYQFLRKYPNIGRKCNQNDSLDVRPEVKVIENAAEIVEPKVSQAIGLDEIKNTIVEIEALESQLKEKKEWLKMLMSEYVK